MKVTTNQETRDYLYKEHKRGVRWIVLGSEEFMNDVWEDKFEEVSSEDYEHEGELYKYDPEKHTINVLVTKVSHTNAYCLGLADVMNFAPFNSDLTK